MFGMRGKKPPQPAAGDGDADERDDAKDREPAKEAAPEKEKGKGKAKVPDNTDDAPKDPADAKPVAPVKGDPAGKFGLILGFVLITLIGGGAGAGAGMYLGSSLEQSYSERQKVEAEADKDKPPVIIKYSGNRVLEPIEPVVTNLASPADVWIRLETAIIFANGTVKDPKAVAAEIRQDILAYCRTITLDQLQGPSALQHLREDLNDRVQLRTNGAVNELVVESMVVQ